MFNKKRVSEKTRKEEIAFLAPKPCPVARPAIALAIAKYAGAV